MSDAAMRISWERGKVIAERICHVLRPGCERIEVAGSLRRLKPDIGDIEIVCIPKRVGLMEDSALDPILQEQVEAVTLMRIKNGEKFKQFDVAGERAKLDLFIADVDTWGCIFTIRTGPAEFSKRLVTQQSQGGLCPSWLKFSGGRIVNVHCDDAPLTTPEEADVFEAVKLAYIKPENRT